MPETPVRRIGRLKAGVIAYALLLLVSGVFRWAKAPLPPRADQVTQELPPVKDGAVLQGDAVHMAYADSGPGGPGRPSPVLLLHGSPAASTSMMGLHAGIASAGYRALTPDLPGFGRSTRDIPDYSAKAHARYLLAWMDSLGVASAHFLAYSMSGAVTLEAYRMAPERVRSIIMLSAIGVQELELTGDYHLNHAVHAIQLGGLWLLREGVPHFGFLDDAMLGVPYARNFYETDQRPLRAILRSYDAPMQIIHAEDDPLVPVGAAIEHARLVPQSEFVRLADGGHGLPFARAESTAELITEFISRVEGQRVPARATAEPQRILEAARPFDPATLPPPSPFTVGILIFLVAMATLVSEDLASIGSGLMAARGTFTFFQASLAAFSGIVVGDLALYAAGRWLGRPALARRPLRWFVSTDKLAVGEKWFDEKGIRAVLVARFIPGTRLPTYVAAGVLKAPFLKFLFYFLISALLWTPALVGASMLLGREVLAFYTAFEAYALWVLLALVLLLFVGFRLVPLLFSHRGRRRLAGRWKRLTEWEFWPPWVFYPPVVLWCIWLAIRYRSLRAPTAANPAIPHSGLIGESKAAILDGLPARWVAEYDTIPPDMDGSRAVDLVEAFLETIDSAYPVVLKPDVGERGRGVRIARSAEDVRAYFGPQVRPAKTVVQRFIPGHEFGVFYFRDPASGQGRILSITDKRFPAVTGDGQSTLHDLIFDDPRAVAMLGVYESTNAAQLDSVPAAGQSVPLVELGTHCRGALFVDGQQLDSEALSTTINAIADQFPGFHFGRFDLRAESAESLTRGQGFKIIELNGLTSEATHIYDPSNSLRAAYRTLFHQWELAWQIGGKNIQAGERPSSWASLGRLVISQLRGTG